jgi:small subunit ribosomal protein S20
MAYHKSAKKRIRQTKFRTAVNRMRVTRLRTFLKKIDLAVASGDAGAAREAFKNAQPEIMRSAQKGIIHRNKAARSLSRLSARISAMET